LQQCVPFQQWCCTAYLSSSACRVGCGAEMEGAATELSCTEGRPCIFIL
jgi:hypothetical protein